MHREQHCALLSLLFVMPFLLVSKTWKNNSRFFGQHVVCKQWFGVLIHRWLLRTVTFSSDEEHNFSSEQIEVVNPEIDSYFSFV